MERQVAGRPVPFHPPNPGRPRLDAVAEIEARKREALVQLALNALPFKAHKALWETLDVSYFMRHEAADIAWHTRHLSRHVGTTKPIVRARQSLAGKACRYWFTHPDQPLTCLHASAVISTAWFQHSGCQGTYRQQPLRADSFQVVASSQPGHYRELTHMVESDFVRAIEAGGPLPEPAQQRVSRRVKAFHSPPRVATSQTKAQRWLLGISASDRAGLLYLVARILAHNHLSVPNSAKVSTLGER